MLDAWKSQPNEQIMTRNHPMTQQAIDQFQNMIADLEKWTTHYVV